MDIIINKTIIDKALKFYNISDREYKEKCYACIDEINNNCELMYRINNVYNLLFIDRNDNIRKLWNIKNISDLFGEISNQYITSILLLGGYNIHEANMKKYSLDKEQINIHKQRVRETLLNDIKIRGYEGIRISQMIWGAYFVNMRIIEVGRLQYEFSRYNPLNEKEYKECIKIHIPSGERLKEELVKESLLRSRTEILKYFNLAKPDYYCSSWLLSPAINSILDKTSNISKFYNLFDIIDEKDGIDDALNFIFNLKECSNYRTLPENTCLQRKVKAFLLEGKNITVGLGILKNLELLI